MKYLFFTFLFVITNLSFSQGKEIVIIDASSQNPIPFCSVDFLNNDGAFSNEQGIFLINLDQVNKVKVKHLSYEDTDPILLNTIDTIKLTPKITNLKVVEINRQLSSKYFSIGYTKRKSFFSIALNPKTEFIVFIKPPEKLVNSTINAIEIPISKSNYFSIGQTNQFAIVILKLNIYNVNRTLLFSQIVKIPIDKSIDAYKLVTLDTYVNFDTGGMFFGVEMVGFVDEYNRLISSKKQDFITLKIFESKENNQTYYKNVFYKNGYWNLIDKNINVFNINTDKNFNLGLTLNLSYN